jgi:hypothetical protein
MCLWRRVRLIVVYKSNTTKLAAPYSESQGLASQKYAPPTCMVTPCTMGDRDDTRRPAIVRHQEIIRGIRDVEVTSKCSTISCWL